MKRLPLYLHSLAFSAPPCLCVNVDLGLSAGLDASVTHHTQSVRMDPRITLITLGVSDLPRAVRFYGDGLAWPTTYQEGGEVAFFNTAGTRLSLYPLNHLASDIGPDVAPARHAFTGLTIAHNVRNKEDVAKVLALAERAGGKIVKPAQDVFWGGHSGYFTDPDGFHWEVAWNPHNPLDEKGFMTLTP
jgi:catechol 2,3-dioxygenase-like lactoylglutathione lyase family enzyme